MKNITVHFMSIYLFKISQNLLIFTLFIYFLLFIFPLTFPFGVVESTHSPTVIKIVCSNKVNIIFFSEDTFKNILRVNILFYKEKMLF